MLDRARPLSLLCRLQRVTPWLRSARACCQNAMMMTGAPIKLTQADAADDADLYNRCSDYFLLQDGAAPTLDDARELFSDVPPEKSAHHQAVLGWKWSGRLYSTAAIPRHYPRVGHRTLCFYIVS